MCVSFRNYQDRKSIKTSIWDGRRYNTFERGKRKRRETIRKMEYSGEMGGRKEGWGRREDWKIRSGNERQIWKWSNFHRSNSYPPALEVPGIEKHFTITSRENLRHGSRSAITQLAEYYFLHLRSSVTLGKSTSLSSIQHIQRGYSKNAHVFKLSIPVTGRPPRVSNRN